jgi:hypothetical protein
VRQGDVISPKLFTAALEDMFKLLDWRGYGININGEYMTHLRFADDIVVMAETLEDLSTMLEVLNRVSQQMGLKMNMDKTKIMSNSRVVPTPIEVGNSTRKLLISIYTWDKLSNLVNPTSRKRSPDESNSDGQRSGSYAAYSRPIYRSASRRKSLIRACCQ